MDRNSRLERLVVALARRRDRRVLAVLGLGDDLGKSSCALARSADEARELALLDGNRCGARLPLYRAEAPVHRAPLLSVSVYFSDRIPRMAQDLSSAGALAVTPPSPLARIPGWEAQRPSAIAALPGGTINTSFRVDTRAGSFVLRLNGEAGAVLGADHTREAQLHAAAARAGVAPELIYADIAERFMIMRFVDGAAWDA